MTIKEYAMILKDKIAIVTGGSYGIGRGIAKAFAENGAEVIICARGAKRMEETRDIIFESAGKKISFMACDVTKREDVERVTAFAIKEFGRIDILVNNAAIQQFSPILDMTDALWDDHFAVNVKGVFLFTQVAAREMVKAGKGKIINIASDSGCAPLPDNASAYCATKAAVISLTRNTAKELGPLGIHCNSISPGAIGDTAMMDYYIGYTNGKGLQQCIDGAALRRLGTPADIGNTALFLASGMSDFITGENILVTGGDLMV
jgi:NAD(P)-dependent dehydrogenase (short-subunit alcohol dehydrogenase family)